jgi:hypothetical protein
MFIHGKLEETGEETAVAYFSLRCLHLPGREEINPKEMSVRIVTIPLGIRIWNPVIIKCYTAVKLAALCNRIGDVWETN